jgi:threonine dehydrogenase-like Zn-dependent dehydrogenase
MGGPGYADLVVMEAGNLLPLPAGVRDEEALGEPLACQGEAFARTPFRAHDRVAVVGLGYMGLGFLQLAHLTDPSALIGVDLIEGRRNLALALGATESYHPDQVPGGYRSSANTTFPLDGRCNVVVEATGSAKGLALASELAAPDGTLVVLGYHASGPLNLDLSLWYRSVTIVNGYSDNRARRLDAMSRGLELIAQRRITFAPLITHRFSLNEVDAAFRLFEERPAGFLKAVIVP